MGQHESSRLTAESSHQKPANHDELVKIILRRVGPLHLLKKELLKRTGRKFVTRMTIKRAMETAVRYLLANEVYSPAMDDWQMELEEVKKHYLNVQRNDVGELLMSDDFQFVKGDRAPLRNTIPLRAKFRALQLVGEDKQAKEALAIVASEFDLDGAKNSWTKFAGSTINRFRTEIRNRLAKDDEEVVSLMAEFGVELGTEETATSEEEI